MSCCTPDYKHRNFTKLLGLGLSRTGTTSVAHAWEALGIRQIHYPMDARTYYQLAEDNANLQVLWDYDALSDITTFPVWERLDKLWPGSKFVLTVRSRETWIPSLKAHWDRGGRPICEAARDVWPIGRLLLTKVFGQLDWDEEKFWEAHVNHMIRVRNYFADRPQDLLVMDVCDQHEGWEPLCKFLDLPVPDLPFPHVMKRAAAGTKESTAGFSPVDYQYPKPKEKPR